MNNELTGLIIAKKSKKVYDKKSKYHGNQFYKLTILNEINQERKLLFAYPNVVSSEIFQAIKQSQYIDRRYFLICQKTPKRLILLDWKELTEKQNNQFKEYENI